MLKDGAKTVASALVELIRRDIIAGSLPPGSRLPIKALSERYGAGPIPIREALARLSAVGLVTAHEQRGFWVAQTSSSELESILALRLNLEVIALKESIANGTYEWEAQLLAAHHRLAHHTARNVSDKSTSASEEWDKAHRAYHLALLAGCKSRWLMQFVNTLSDQMNRYRHLSMQSADSDGRDIAAEHKAMLDAALARDADRAAALLEAHLTRTAALALQAMARMEAEARSREPAKPVRKARAEKTLGGAAGPARSRPRESVK